MVKTFSRGFYLSLFIEIEYIQLHGIRSIVLSTQLYFYNNHILASQSEKSILHDTT